MGVGDLPYHRFSRMVDASPSWCRIIGGRASILPPTGLLSHRRTPFGGCGAARCSKAVIGRLAIAVASFLAIIISFTILLSAFGRSLADIAQLVEQWTENPRVGGSIPPGTTKSLRFRRLFFTQNLHGFICPGKPLFCRQVHTAKKASRA